MEAINNFRYDDDFLLLVVSPEATQELVNRFERGAGDYNMAINDAKTKTMTNTEEVLEIEVSAKRLEQVNFFV